MWCYDNSNKSVQISIVPHFPSSVKFAQVISLKLFFMLRGNGSLGSWYYKTIHSSSRCHNHDEKISEEEVLEVSLGEKSHGHRSFETIHSSSSNFGYYKRRWCSYLETRHTSSSNLKGSGRISSMTSHSSYRNRRVYVYIVESRSQYTIHYSSFNQGKIVNVEWRCRYRHPNSHYSPPNQGGHGIFLTFSGDTVGVDVRVGYRSKNIQS